MNSDSNRQVPALRHQRADLLAKVLAVVGVASVSLSAVSVAAAAGTPPGLAKSYAGAARNITASQTGGISLTSVAVTGGRISGTATFHSPLAGSGPFTGSITSTSVNFTVKPTASTCPSCTTIMFTGSISPLVSMSGTWVAHLKSGPSQEGVWEVGSTWNGGYSDSSGTGILRFAGVTENAKGAVSGTLVWPNAGQSFPFTGSVRGSVIKLTAPNGGESQEPITFTGTLSAALGGMSGVFTETGYTGKWQAKRSGAAAAV